MYWLLLLLLAVAACGGGGSPPSEPPPNPLYVSTEGRDTNVGNADSPLHSIRKAAQLAGDGYEIVVAPGRYREEVTTDRTGKPAQGITLLADVTGARSETAPGPVIIDVSSVANASGVSLSNSSGSVIDGFTVIGAADAGIVLKSGSRNVTIRHCVIHDNLGDGVRIQDSASVELLNNLVYRNAGTGIVIAGQRNGSPDARLINNSVALNGARGVTVGTTAAASPRAFLRNNIIAANGGPGALQLRVISEVPRSDVGFDGDYDLIFPALYDPTSISGAHDLHDDPGFASVETDDYHLITESPAIDAGDDGIDPALANLLHLRTTTGSEPDGGQLDLGYHFRD